MRLQIQTFNIDTDFIEPFAHVAGSLPSKLEHLITGAQVH
jgi:hypothetical protein